MHKNVCITCHTSAKKAAAEKAEKAAAEKAAAEKALVGACLQSALDTAHSTRAHHEATHREVGRAEAASVQQLQSAISHRDQLVLALKSAQKTVEACEQDLVRCEEAKSRSLSGT